MAGAVPAPAPFWAAGERRACPFPACRQAGATAEQTVRYEWRPARPPAGQALRRSSPAVRRTRKKRPSPPARGQFFHAPPPLPQDGARPLRKRTRRFRRRAPRALSARVQALPERVSVLPAKRRPRPQRAETVPYRNTNAPCGRATPLATAALPPRLRSALLFPPRSLSEGKVRKISPWQRRRVSPRRSE